MVRLFRYAFSIGLILLLAGCTQPPYESVCRVAVEKPGNKLSVGSGTLVGVSGDTALVLTCRHVTELEGRACEMTWRTGEKTKGRVVEVQPERRGNALSNDLALIVCDRPAGISPVEVVKFRAEDGPFYSYGYRPEKGNVMNMLVSVSRTAREHEGLIYLSAPVLPGLSGGATCNRFDQQVGVCVAADFDMDLNGNITRIGDESWAADGEYLTEMLERYQQ